MTNQTRRGFIQGGVALLSASQIGRVSIEEIPTIYGDGQTNDAPSLQALIDGNPFRHRNEILCARSENTVLIKGGRYLLDAPLKITNKRRFNLVGISDPDRPVLLVSNKNRERSSMFLDECDGLLVQNFRFGFELPTYPEKDIEPDNKPATMDGRGIHIRIECGIVGELTSREVAPNGRSACAPLAADALKR